MSKLPARSKEFDAAMVRDISEHVYRQRLSADDLASMLEKDGDNGKKLRERASGYDALTRCYLRAFPVLLAPRGVVPGAVLEVET